MQHLDLNHVSCVFILKNLLKSLTDNEVDYLLKKSVIKRYQKNEIILSKINTQDDLYILLDGIIQIGYLSSAGRFHAFYYYSQENFINLVACLKEISIDHDYYAFNQVKVLIIPKAIFFEILKINKSLSADLLDVVSDRMHYLIEEVKFLHVANLHQKLCRVLFNLSNQYGIYHPLGTEIKLKISQNDLADLLSTSRQTVNKEIKKLITKNLIKCNYENIILMDFKYFEEHSLI